jgi:hypothetical protein
VPLPKLPVLVADMVDHEPGKAGLNVSMRDGADAQPAASTAASAAAPSQAAAGRAAARRGKGVASSVMSSPLEGMTTRR